MVTEIQDKKEKEIMDIVEDLNTKILFDTQLAFSKRWVNPLCFILNFLNPIHFFPYLSRALAIL